MKNLEQAPGRKILDARLPFASRSRLCLNSLLRWFPRESSGTAYFEPASVSVVSICARTDDNPYIKISFAQSGLPTRPCFSLTILPRRSNKANIEASNIGVVGVFRNRVTESGCALIYSLDHVIDTRICRQ